MIHITHDGFHTLCGMTQFKVGTIIMVAMVTPKEAFAVAQHTDHGEHIFPSDVWCQNCIGSMTGDSPRRAEPAQPLPAPPPAAVAGLPAPAIGPGAGAPVGPTPTRPTPPLPGAPLWPAGQPAPPPGEASVLGGVLRFVFDEDWGPAGPRLIEVEDGHGRGINAGEWRHEPPYWVLYIPDSAPAEWQAEIEEIRRDEFQRREEYQRALAPCAQLLLRAEELLASAQHGNADDKWRRDVSDYFSDHERGVVIKTIREST